MGAGAMTICHNQTAVLVREDMKRMVQIPMLRSRAVAAQSTKVFGASLWELRERGLVEDGVPLLVRRMVEHLSKHALHQEGLFRVNGNVRAVETLKLRLESGGSSDDEAELLSESDLCTVSSLLKRYLRDLPGGLVGSTVQQKLIQHYQDSGGDVSWLVIRDVLQQLPDVHHSLLRYLCSFLTLVEKNHEENRMTAQNLATVFGPSVFQVAPSPEAVKDQNICNEIMVQFIQNYSCIFEAESPDKEDEMEERSTLSLVQAKSEEEDTKKSSNHLSPVPQIATELLNSLEDMKHLNKSCTKTPKTKKTKIRKGRNDGMPQVVCQQRQAQGSPSTRSFSIPIVLPLTSELRSPSPEVTDTSPLPEPDSSRTASPHVDFSLSGSTEGLSSSQDEERPASPFYMSNHLSPVRCRPDVVKSFLDQTIRSAVEQHLFDIADQHSVTCDLTSRPSSLTGTPTARQRRRQQREQQAEGLRQRNRAASTRADTNKENIPSSSCSSSGSVGEEPTSGVESQGGQSGRADRTSRKSKHCPTLVQLTDNQPAHTIKECFGERPGETHMDPLHKGNEISRKDRPGSASQTLRMKIQESPVACDAGRIGGGEVRASEPDREDVPRLDLTALTEDSSWGDSPFPNSCFLDFKSVFHAARCDEPILACPLQRESMDREEARLSPHAGGRLIRQLLEEDSDPMVSPRFYAYGHSQQYLDDTEVPPSPPNAHSFISRRRSSSLGSCDDEREELTSAQLTKRIHVLKKKIQRFEEKFEDDRKYRPSHSDKAANPEVLRWLNELARLRKELKERKLMKSEEDLPPVTRQRSNTLPKSFGSQLDKKTQQEKAPKPPVESTLESVQKKLQEKRQEVNRPEDIKDMTRDQIGAEKVALQKALLHYESIHGRPVTKSERQIMKPLYDRYRLVKQILCRASTIPVIGSPSSKRRGPLLQPIIEGETALFFDDIKEEEDGSEDDGDTKTHFTENIQPELSVFSFMDEEVDGFISPVDELSPSKTTADMGLSNLHSATMQELMEQLQETREEKKRIRKNLKEFEDQFFRQNGRTVQKEDRSPLADEYHEYKHVKAKLRLLEVLISKRDSTKLI
ncbi:PREDICTED: protein FAM13A isoform X3 [Poecilia mexicana]|uniref:protein FAM13A isoform X3 n=1 Tax=Poecilia mexicana TaxID=48701 RepID=UPI00072EAF4A|nr:PREDICTED: protein FAM13A isoform X3 [Poecilia mexicana]